MGGSAAHAGHAFAIAGYDERAASRVQELPGSDRRSHGVAILGYEDWIATAMDCWVAQLGVVTAEHRELSQRATLKMSGGRASPRARCCAIASSPYIVNLGNDGQLSASGPASAPRPDDLRALAGPCLERASGEHWEFGTGRSTSASSPTAAWLAKRQQPWSRRADPEAYENRHPARLPDVETGFSTRWPT
ncbi:MAG: hypothetical protein IPG91_13250 [Ideonella sp.]|nr:hypothetical protein [Ideonella sp.]